MPDGALIVGLTPERALVYSQSGCSGKPKAVSLPCPADIAAIEVGKDKVGAAVTSRSPTGGGFAIYEHRRIG